MTMRRRDAGIVSLGGLCVVAACAGLSTAVLAQDDPVTLAQKGAAATAAAIKGGKGRVIVRETQLATKSETVRTYDVVSSGDRFLVRKTVTVGSGDQDAVITGDGTSYQYFEPRTQIGYAGLMASGMRHSDCLRVLRDIRMPGKGITTVGALEIPGVKSEVKVVGREVIDGDECVIIDEVRTEETAHGVYISTIRYWTDPAKGFTTLRRALWCEVVGSKPKALMYESETKVVQYGGGVWGPSENVATDYARTESGGSIPESRRQVTYAADFVVNPTVSDKDLRFDLPSGAHLYDEAQAKMVTVP